jgi:hypothetical protein
MSRKPNFVYLTEEQVEADEAKFDIYPLKQKIKIKGIIINTIGDLKKIVKNTTIARKLENFLHEDDFSYIFDYILYKEISKGIINPT